MSTNAALNSRSTNHPDGEAPLLYHADDTSEARHKRSEEMPLFTHDESAEGRTFPSFPDQCQQSQQQRRRSRQGLWTLLVLLALTTLATRLFSLPLNRVIELRYCRAYYEQRPSLLPPGAGGEGEIPEELCKVKEVQQRLAWLQGVIETAVIGIDLGVTMPLGWVGDRFGRRVVLACNAVGFVGMVVWVVLVGHLDQALPVEAMVAGPFFTLLGGHDCVLNSTIFAVVTDLTDDLIQRTSYIAYITSVNYVISLFGPSLASITMSRNIWLPFYLSIGLLVAVLPTIYMLPNTTPPSHKRNKSSSTVENEQGTTPEAESLLGTAGPHISRSSSPSTSNSHSSSLLKRLFAPLVTLSFLVLGRRNFQIHLLGGFLLPALASSNTHLLPQYTSKRYGWKFEHVGYLLSVKAAVNITLLALVIPTTMKFLLRRMPGKEVRLNYRGAQVSLAVSILGAFCIALATGVGQLMAALIVYALGSALPVFTMSLVESAPIAAGPAHSHHDDDDGDDGRSGSRTSGPAHQQKHTSAQRDYSVVMLVKTAGSLVGAPLMTFAWVKGIGVGGAALGLPYFLSAILYACAISVLCFLEI